jgi:hypothetical protein
MRDAWSDLLIHDINPRPLSGRRSTLIKPSTHPHGRHCYRPVLVRTFPILFSFFFDLGLNGACKSYFHRLKLCHQFSSNPSWCRRSTHVNTLAPSYLYHKVTTALILWFDRTSGQISNHVSLRLPCLHAFTSLFVFRLLSSHCNTGKSEQIAQPAMHVFTSFPIFLYMQPVTYVYLNIVPVCVCSSLRCHWPWLQLAQQPNSLQVLLPACLLVQIADHVQLSSSSTCSSQAAAAAALCQQSAIAPLGERYVYPAVTTLFWSY